MKFLDLFKAYIKYHDTTFDFFDKRKKGTITNYYIRYNHVVDFLIQTGRKDILAMDFTITVAKSFLTYLREQGKQHNTSIHIVYCMKAVLGYAASNEMIPYNPLAALKLRKLPPDLPVHLNMDELIKLQEYQPTGRMYKKAKDLFMFQCLTGLDYGDLMTVGKRHILHHGGMSYIVKKRNKNGNESIIPYTDQARLIFEKYNYNLKILSNQKYNTILKTIAQKININKHLTTHVGRKTFAMYMLNQEGYTLEALSKILGHKKISTTETYYTQRTLDLVHRAVLAHEERSNN